MDLSTLSNIAADVADAFDTIDRGETWSKTFRATRDAEEALAIAEILAAFDDEVMVTTTLDAKLGEWTVFVSIPSRAASLADRINPSPAFKAAAKSWATVCGLVDWMRTGDENPHAG